MAKRSRVGESSTRCMRVRLVPIFGPEDVLAMCENGESGHGVGGYDDLVRMQREGKASSLLGGFGGQSGELDGSGGAEWLLHGSTCSRGDGTAPSVSRGPTGKQAMALTRYHEVEQIQREDGAQLGREADI